jgi:ribosomal protein L16 Arg81 hydroxylase
LYNDKGVFSAADFPNLDEKRHPLMKNITPMEVVIGPGEALFIPIGWWHCVESLDMSMSISFTNFNAPNNFSTEFPKG